MMIQEVVFNCNNIITLLEHHKEPVLILLRIPLGPSSSVLKAPERHPPIINRQGANSQ